jgi:uncharacterized membrane protein YfcA
VTSGPAHLTRRCLRPLIVIVLALVLLLISSHTAYAATGANQAADQMMNMSPALFALVLLFICIVIGIVAPLGGVGGGVIFTPLMMGFTPINSFIVRATGLLVAMFGSLRLARPYLRRGLANIRLLLLAGVPYSISAVSGALLAGYVQAKAGESGEASIRLILGILVMAIALLLLFGGKSVEYPDIKKVDKFTEKLSLGMSYWEASLDKIVNYRVNRAPVGIILFCIVGLISGLFGMGAGWATVPVFNLVMLAPLKVAATSSSVLISIGDTAAVWPYLAGGGIFPLVAVPCTVGMVVGATIGSRIMLKIRPSFVRWVIITAMFASGIKLIFDGISQFGII